MPRTLRKQRAWSRNCGANPPNLAPRRSTSCSVACSKLIGQPIDPNFNNLLTRTNVLFRLYDGAVKSAQIVEFLKALRLQLGRRLLRVWDGAAQHRSRIVRDYLDSTLGASRWHCCPATRPT